MSKCIILSRVSTARQELDSQTQAIKNEALRQGFKEKDFILIEDIESAIKLSEEERNGLNRMKSEIVKNPDITHVFIYELSRLSRRQLVLFSIRDYLIEHNIQLVCCTPYFRLLEDGKLSQTANLMFSIFASMAESEMELKKERMKRGRERNKMTGKNSSGLVLYGYKTLDDKTIVVDEEKSQFVIDLFTLYASGLYSEYQLAEELVARHGDIKDTVAKTRSKISHMLKQKRYCGDSQYPQLISEELFEQARAMAKQNKHNNKRQIKDESLLKKIIYDRDSGYHMTYSSNVNRPRYSLKCKYDGTTVTTIMLRDIDDRVWHLAVELHKSYVIDSERVRNELQEKIDIAVNKMLNAQIKIKQTDDKIDKIEERLVYGMLSQDKAEQMEAKLVADKKENENLTARLSEEIATLQSLIDTTGNAPDYDAFSREDKITLIRQMIDRIEIWKKSRYEPVADIYTKVDKCVYHMFIDSLHGTCYLQSEFLPEPNINKGN